MKHSLCTILIALGTLSLPECATACNSPLILDLNGDGIRTTTTGYPVSFDFKDDGNPEISAWTAPDSKEAFLWLDVNDNGTVDSGRELFGDATILPSGETSRHGFEALEVYDTEELGGNGDLVISEEDLIWRFLKLWDDANHDGISQRDEISTLEREGVASIDLQYTKSMTYDPADNLHLFQSSFIRRVNRQFGPPYLRSQPIHDVFFQEAPREEE
jgi:hypothetical protein